MKIQNDLLAGNNVSLNITEKTSGPFAPGELDTIIIHYTASGSVESAVRSLCDTNLKVSAHLVVGRNGEIVQLAPFTVKTWHAGNSSYKGRSGYNNYSIGIELENPGYVTKNGEMYTAWFGKTYSAEDVVLAVHNNETMPRYWVKYTQKQVSIIEEICLLLIAKYNIKYILGHDQIAPSRKQDPGPAFPMAKLIDRLVTADQEPDSNEESFEQKRSFVAVDKLNIRSAPDINAEKIALPLQKGVELIVLQEKNGWVLVDTTIRGWVASQYLKC
jgi:N-acetylmuramoyl-L-alanine amidase